MSKKVYIIGYKEYEKIDIQKIFLNKEEAKFFLKEFNSMAYEPANMMVYEITTFKDGV